MNDKITVIHHSADFDGLFCREIARKFLPTAELIGWDYADAKLPFPAEGTVYVLDLSPDCFAETVHQFGTGEKVQWLDGRRLIWIDHHKSAIEKWPADILGYRVDGVAACRLAWQWFTHDYGPNNPNCQPVDYDLPQKDHFISREVSEPEAVRLAGEYDIWDKRDPRADLLQLGLRARPISAEEWAWLLTTPGEAKGEYELGMVNVTLGRRLQEGKLLQSYVDQRDAAIVTACGFLTEFAGLKFLALNSATKGSLQFAAKDVPATGHEALLKFNFTGRVWDVSLYHAQHRTDLDLSPIAVAHGGGGHRGACGFRTDKLPFL